MGVVGAMAALGAVEVDEWRRVADHSWQRIRYTFQQFDSAATTLSVNTVGILYTRYPICKHPYTDSKVSTASNVLPSLAPEFSPLLFPMRSSPGDCMR